MSWTQEWRIDSSSRIQHGNQGSVVRVFDCTERQGALKRMKPVDLERSERLARFTAEAAILEKLNIPGVPRVLERGVDDEGAPYFISEWVEGRTLTNVVNGRPQPLHHAIDVCQQLVHLLEAVHAQGVVHRDIKPDNLLVSEKGKLWLVDFGISWNNNAVDQQLTEAAGSRIGNYFLTLPEHLENAEKRDLRSDLTQAVGILFYLLTGRKPSQLRNSFLHAPHEREPEASELRARIEGTQLTALLSLFDVGFAQTLPHRFQCAEQLLFRLVQLGQRQAQESSRGDQLSLAKASYLAARQAIDASIDEIEAKLVTAVKTVSSRVAAVAAREGFEGPHPTATQVVRPGREVATLWKMCQKGHGEPCIFYKLRACLVGTRQEILELRLTAQHSPVSTVDKMYFQVPAADITGFVSAAEKIADEILGDAIRDLTRRIAG